MPEPKRPLKVFLCHASTDKPKVRELYRYLKKRGIQPWFDEEDLVGGQDWQVEIPKALATSDAIIICLTKNSVDKEGYVQNEIKFALDKALGMPEGRIFLIPVKFEECEVPFTLSRYQWVDLTVESGYAKMMKALKFRASQLERSTVEVSKRYVEEENLARKKMEKETVEKAHLKVEEEERRRIAREEAEQEAAQKIAREKIQRELDKRTKDIQRKYNREIFFSRLRNKLSLFLLYFRSYVFPTILFLGIAAGVLYMGKPFFERTFPTPPSYTATEIIAPSSTPTKSFTPTATALPPEISQAIVDCLYVVDRGDYLAQIAEKFGIGDLNWGEISCAPDDIMGCDMSQPSKITIGWRVIVPNVIGNVCAENGGEPQITSEMSLPTEITDAKGVSMALVPAGEFIMGSDNYPEESPTHTVYLDSFYMDKYEVTNVFYKACVTAGVCKTPQQTKSYFRSAYYDNSEYDNYPVLFVNWNQAKTYCEWRGGNLPTEAQWEKAARGTDGRTYPWGEGIDCSKSNYWEADNDNGCGKSDTTAVGSYKNGVSPYGIYDMAGNAQEWVADWYSNTYYQNSPLSNPLGPNSGQYRVLRSGSVVFDGVDVRSSDRSASSPDKYEVFGFRCTRDANP